MKKILAFIFTCILFVPFALLSQGYAEIQTETENSQIVIDFSDTLDVAGNSIKVKFGKYVTILENIKPGYISKSASFLYSRVKSTDFKLKGLTEIPVLDDMDKRILINSINFDSLATNFNAVVHFSHADYLMEENPSAMFIDYDDLNLDKNQVNVKLLRFLQHENLSHDLHQGSMSIPRNTLRLDIDLKSLKIIELRDVFSCVELEFEFGLSDLRFREVAKETLTVRSKYSKKLDVNESVLHVLKEGVCQFIENSQKNEWLQLGDSAHLDSFSELVEIEFPQMEHINFADARNSVVTIITKNGHGSGCLISENGHVLTNFHVVAKSDTIKVVTFQGDTILGSLSMSDPSLDIAVISIEKKFKDYFVLRENPAKLGEIVYAIGTPINLKLSHSISKGIISSNLMINEINYIQTDAEINGGNSGGALVNTRGELLGIVNAKAVGISIEGIGFAISLKSIIDRINISYK